MSLGNIWYVAYLACLAAAADSAAPPAVSRAAALCVSA